MKCDKCGKPAKASELQTTHQMIMTRRYVVDYTIRSTKNQKSLKLCSVCAVDMLHEILEDINDTPELIKRGSYYD